MVDVREHPGLDGLVVINAGERLGELGALPVDFPSGPRGLGVALGGGEGRDSLQGP